MKITIKCKFGHYSKLTTVPISIHIMKLVISHHLLSNSVFLYHLVDHQWSVFIALVYPARLSMHNRPFPVYHITWSAYAFLYKNLCILWTSSCYEHVWWTCIPWFMDRPKHESSKLSMAKNLLIVFTSHTNHRL